MSGETEASVSGWTIDTWRYHTDALRRADEALSTERDRRYAEISAEREKALKIKEKADDDALELARQIQTYKDEKANNLRAQIEGERGDYARVSDLKSAVEKFELAIKPLSDYVAADRGHGAGLAQSWGVVAVVLALLVDIGTRFIK